jgi:uncharacterized cupredoxin-like copper-binding protein
MVTIDQLGDVIAGRAGGQGLDIDRDGAKDVVIGTAAELAEHQREMTSGSAAHHHSASEISVEAGKSREVIRRFDKSGELAIACFEPGHYEAGMKGTLTVLPRP